MGLKKTTTKMVRKVADAMTDVAHNRTARDIAKTAAIAAAGAAGAVFGEHVASTILKKKK